MDRAISFYIAILVLVIFACGANCFCPPVGIEFPSKITHPNRWVFREHRTSTTPSLYATSADSSSRDATRPRVVSIDSDWNVTIYEFQHASELIDGYWESSSDKDLDPFGFVAWPGSVMAARELRKAKHLVDGKNVLILGAGVGIEAQAALELGAQKVVATDINPSTLELLEKGITQGDTKIETRLFDITKYAEPLPEPFDLLVVADVLYDEDLVKHVAQRCRQADPRPVLITDSQNFATFPRFPNMESSMTELESFTGSGVVIEDDQTYDVDVTIHWLRQP